MDVKKYWFSSSSQATQSIRLGRSYTKPRGHRSYVDGPRTVWDMLRRKLKRDKKEVYDPETYFMNFDQGAGSMEPDNLCRSFSARFADPSRILPQKHLLDS